MILERKCGRYRHSGRPACKRTCGLSREDTHENYFNCCSLPAGPDLYGLWAEWISQLPPPAAPGGSTGTPVLCCRQHIALCCLLFRSAGSWRIAAALRLLRTTCTDSAGGGALQHPCVSPDACAGEHSSGSGSVCALDTGFPPISGKLQRRSSSKALAREIVYSASGKHEGHEVQRFACLDRHE